MAKGNYILIHRRIMNWEWYKDSNTFRVFMHCLLRANWRAGRFKSKQILPGQFVTSLERMSKETDLTVDKIRTAIKHLEITQEITHEKIPQGLIITIKNWSRYQGIPTQYPTQIPQESHTNPNDRINNIINNKEFKKNEAPSESPKKDMASMTDEEWLAMSDEEWEKAMKDGAV